jgi:anti-anti-sigma factor
MLSLRMSSEALDHIHLDSWQEETSPTLRVPGRLDSGAAKLVARQAEQMLQNGERQILVDMTGTAGITNAGLRVLLILARALQRLGGEFALYGIQTEVRRTFELTGFNQMLTIYRDEIEAEAALRASAHASGISQHNRRTMAA